jgi:hypothetical protein
VDLVPVEVTDTADTALDSVAVLVLVEVTDTVDTALDSVPVEVTDTVDTALEVMVSVDVVLDAEDVSNATALPLLMDALLLFNLDPFTLNFATLLATLATVVLAFLPAVPENPSVVNLLSMDAT